MPVLMILFLIMFGLKLAGVGTAAALSWWLVTLPLWIIPAIFAATFIVVGGLGAAAYLVSMFAELVSSTLKQRRMIKEAQSAQKDK